MTEVNESLTLKVAHLAHLELSPEEVQAFTPQLKKILNYIDELAQVNVDGVEPMTHPIEMETPLREDRAEPFGVDAQGEPKVLKNSPEVIQGGYKVPPIL